ncbi:hypothetical protein [Cohnella terricola]|uniref:Integrase catalytic domain-containing protein n=1 Tax=Cohnella terricola TaxID=1289167 RepID=A0A559JQK5_9BACL|nr:hypothetical protein [Cohnella terricola]TVY02166.1 hypothetical protein FPZ45_06910 [Cohnella terricola]
MLEKYPEIKNMISDLYFGRNRRSLEPIMRPLHIHKKFIEACRAKNIPLNEYPFNTERLGIRALYRYLEKLSKQHFGRSATRYGHDAEQKAWNSGIGQQNRPATITPLQKVQFDAHRIDAIFGVKLLTPEGDEVLRILERFWILTVIDVATRNVLGYSVSLNKEYNASDVMICIRNCVIPHQKKC